MGDFFSTQCFMKFPFYNDNFIAELSANPTRLHMFIIRRKQAKQFINK